MLTREQVAAASSAWIWHPVDAPVVENDDYLLARFPDHFVRTFEVLRTRCERPVDVVIDEVLHHFAADGRSEVGWWVKLDHAPADLAEALERRGGVLDETLDVLARPLDGPAPDLGVPDDIELRWETDLSSARDAAWVGVEVFGGDLPPEEILAGRAERSQKLLAEGNGTVIAYLDGQPVGTGGVHVVDGVARLWNGSTLARHRGRGIYRSLLQSRLHFAVEHGASIALVKGRIETSGPILRRAGFTAYGRETSYVLPTPTD